MTFNPEDSKKLIVGEECSYHGEGHTEAELEVNEDEKPRVTGILGPGGELYTRVHRHSEPE